MHLRSSVVSAVLVGALLQAAPALAAPPPNDAFANAQPLAGASTSAPGTTVEATTEAGEPSHFVSGNGSVWYSWTAPETAAVRLDTCASVASTRIQMYSGSTLASLAASEVPKRSDSGRCNGTTGHDLHVFNVIAGTTYRISVIEHVTDTSFTLSLLATPTPNDSFAGAQDLGQELDVDVDGTTAGATLEPGEPDYFGSPGDGNSVWYRWTAPKRTRVWIDNCNAESNSSLGVYTGTSVGALQTVEEGFDQPRPPGCEPDAVFGHQYEFLATAGTTYMIRVYNAGGFHLRMRDIRFDASLKQTASATKIKKGKTVTYTVNIENVGTVPIDPSIQLFTSKPGQLAKPVVGTKYVSIEITSGKCKTVKFFAEHPGAICDVELAPGDSVRIVAKVKPSQSLDHYAELDYAHGADSPIFDEDRRNEEGEPVTTVVKRKRKHR